MERIIIKTLLFVQFMFFFSASESAVIEEKSRSASWGGLRHKLNQILDNESREMSILHNLLSEDSSETISESMETKDSENHVEILVDDNNKKSAVSEKYMKINTVPINSVSTVASLQEKGIIQKLEDNSKRMDAMVAFLADLRNVLSEAITAQSKQLTFESEVVELREEMEYLRKEVQMLKKEQALSAFNPSSSLENKIHNDETTILWLKESTKELRNQMNDMSRMCNSTTFLQIKQNLGQQTQRQQSDLLVVQRQIEAIQVQQLKQDEQITEAKGNIADVRSWQTNMGQKFIDTQVNFSEEKRQSNEVNDNESESFLEEEHFLTEALKRDNIQGSRSKQRHSRKLKAKLREITKTAKTLTKDHYRFQKRLTQIESIQKTLQDMIGNIEPFQNKDSSKHFNQQNSIDISNRVSGIENTMSEYTITLQGLGEKVNVVNELQESTSQLFTALEGLETRYDEKLTDMQTSLAKMEASVSIINNSNQDMKEQQNFQTGAIQNVKKGLLETKGKLQNNHLRLASIQSQLLKLSSQKCSYENSESIQNIRISSLESMLQTHKNNNKNERTT